MSVMEADQDAVSDLSACLRAVSVFYPLLHPSIFLHAPPPLCSRIVRLLTASRPLNTRLPVEMAVDAVGALDNLPELLS